MTDISKRLTAIRSTLPEGVGLVAVSKFHPVDELRQAYDAGQRAFGESRIQELMVKIPEMPADVAWHFIGHLQTNKVRALVGTRRIALIESIDSERLLNLVDAESERAGITSRVLMQVHVAQEETKFGFTPDELLDYFRSRRFESLKATHICGLMGMASNTDDTDRIRADFEAIASLRRRIMELCPDLRGFDTLSMGMSDDYPLAIAAGSTLVRIGTALFGPREY
ncbi:MAG: YggS family pyridoxal phosphate-dependent enzyme [Bacteroidales bacterium]|nr:YggS family pyridoxal phosphate-dependent enzyme [Bacteroidales bacterium]